MSTVVKSADTSAWVGQSEKNPYLNVPEISSGIGLISRQQEKLIGEKVLREVRHQLPILEDAWLEEEINQIFLGIYSQTGLGKPLALVLINDRQINAFAVPGGLFAINTGLITASNNMGEIAGVVAHEIAHVTQRHYSRSNEAFKGQGLLSLAGLLAGIAIASQAPDAGAAVMLGSQAALMDQKLTYSRNQEREADRVGMQYMAIAGYKPENMADFFEVMHRSTSRLSFLPDFWLTHPLTTERMSEARLRARQFPPVITRPTDQEKFELIRWRAAVLTGIVEVNQLKTLVPRSVGAALALATYYIQQSKFKEAKPILDGIKPNILQEKLLALTWADFYAAQGQYESALAAILPDYLVAPENKVLALAVAQNYRLNKQYDEALKILTDLSVKYSDDPKIWQALYQVELNRTSPVKEINVLRYKAEHQFWNGAEEDAITTLLHADRLAKQLNNESLQFKVKARLQAMQEVYKFKPSSL